MAGKGADGQALPSTAPLKQDSPQLRAAMAQRPVTLSASAAPLLVAADGLGLITPARGCNDAHPSERVIEEGRKASGNAFLALATRCCPSRAPCHGSNTNKGTG